MSYVFNHLDVIKEALKQSPFGLITDIDGTISQTAPTPQQAELSPLCRQHLYTLCSQLTLVAAISGRRASEAKNMVNILDISQTILQENFTMIMLVDLSKMKISFSELNTKLDKKGKTLGLQIKVQREEIFKAMHQV